MCEYKYLGNYHTHTQWCNHGTVSAYEAVREAIESGMKVLGFSEHSPFPDDRFHRMKYAELNNYTAYLNELKIRYKNILDIRIGLEIEFFPKDIPYYYKLLNKYGIDYIILGQHYFDFNGKIIKTKLIENTEMLINYAESISEAMKTGFFSIAAHPDYCFSCDLPIDKHTDRAIQIILDTAEKYGTILEINANGFRKPEFQSCIGLRRRYPFFNFWKSAAAHNIRYIVGSDAHHPGCINDHAVKEAFAFAKKLEIFPIENNIIR